MKELVLNTRPKFITKKGYSTINIIFIYPVVFQKENLADIFLLTQILNCTSKAYPDEQLFSQALFDHLIVKYNVKFRRYGNIIFYEFLLTIPDPKRVKNFDVEAAFKFFLANIYEGNAQDGEFNVQQFKREKEYLQENIKKIDYNIYKYSHEQFFYYFDDKSIDDSLYYNLSILEQEDAKHLYEFYKQVILENEPFVYIYGNPDRQLIKNLFKKYFPKKYHDVSLMADYYTFLKPAKRVNYIEENKPFKQSALYVGYKILDMQEKDQDLLGLVCNLIDAPETDLLFKRLRLENGLVYNVSLDNSRAKGIFYISTYLCAENKDKALKIIEQIMVDIKNPAFIQANLKRILKGTKYELLSSLDNKYTDLDNTLIKDCGYGKTLESTYKAYKAIKVPELIAFMERIQLDTIYFLRGDKDGQN